ncbi:MAG: hypothetical protein MUF71_21565 [Candidatus Kapabacteria bacterium]|nr:hypothetical protein [Candidatus Kapabacteria bacterium]
MAWMQTKQVEIQGTRLSDVQHIAPSRLQANPLNSDFFREESDDYFTKLREDVRTRGIIVPLLAKKDDVLLAGHNRLRVALELGLETVPVQYVLDALPEKAEREFIIKDNLYRRQFSTSEWIQLYQKLYPDFDQIIQQEMRGGGLKWSKGNDSQHKTEHSVLLSETTNEQRRLTAQNIAEDTGQKTSAVQKQLTKYRKELLTKSKNNEAPKKNATKNEPSKDINSSVTTDAEKYLSKIRVSLQKQNPKTIRAVLKKIEIFKAEIENLL